MQKSKEQSFDYFAKAIEHSIDAIVITDFDGNIVYVNPGWEQINGYTKEEVIGKNPRILKSGRTPPALYEHLWETLKAGKPFITDAIINKRKDGTEFYAELVIYPLPDSDGNPAYFVGRHHDITQRKRAEAAQADFVSLASHQLRTPLTGILWALGYLRKKTQLSPEHRGILIDMEFSARRMAETIGTVLKIAHLEQGITSPSNENIDMASLLDAIRADEEAHLRQKEQKLSLDMDNKISLRTDPAILSEILKNLLSNAIKYTPQKGSITIACRQDERKLKIDVSDDGYGIPENQQQNIFSKFFRADNISGLEPEGTGLGLYLVRSLVRLLGGSISFSSIENTGTTFSVYLPLSPPLHE